MSHHRKPADWLRYWNGPIRRDTRFRAVMVYCVGRAGGRRCWHSGRLAIADLPDDDWHHVSARLRCTACGSVGYVDTRVDWSEVIDFDRPAGAQPPS